MIKELKKAMERAETLSSERQLELARLIDEEMGWSKTIEESADKLSGLAEEALKEYKAGKTKNLD